MPPARFDWIPEQHQLLSCWVDNCVRNHSKCREAQQGFTPSRLLQLDCFPGSKDARLVEFSAEMKIGSVPFPYAALSHCWGVPSKRPIRTLKENMAKHRDRIRFEDLSRTFQEAIQVTRGLQLPYIWIDSLCIVQDDGEDWEREADQMAKSTGSPFAQYLPSVLKVGMVAAGSMQARSRWTSCDMST